MNDPIKLIHKYKNNNGRIQYHVYIFIGDIVDNDCMKILKKIADLDFYATLITLNAKETNILVKIYGDYWYEKFFNMRHINFIKEITSQNSLKMEELKKIYGNVWQNKHFIDYKKRYEVTTYDYSSVFKRDRERRTYKKIIGKPHEVGEIVDYTTTSKTISKPSRINGIGNHDFSSRRNLDGYNFYSGTESAGTESDGTESDGTESDGTESDGTSDSEFGMSDSVEEFGISDSSDEFSVSDSSDEFSVSDSSDDENMEIRKQIGGDTDEEILGDVTGEDLFSTEDSEDIVEFEDIVEKDLESAEIFFQEIIEPDKNIKATTKDIKEIISKESYDKLSKQVVEFDTSKDNSMFDENLKDVYQKKYIEHQYIYKDDTIRNVKNKICCGIINNKKFGENTYIIPSFQYIWSEYFFKDKIDKIMIGHKWIVKNDIVKLDIEPNTNMRVYEELRGNLKTLRDNIRRQGKIKLESDDNGILYDYEGFYTYNELYMIDILNEFGLNYDPSFENLKNVAEVYVRIYFPKIRPEDIANIISYLKKDAPENKKNLERTRLKIIYETINNDLILENEIMKDIELVKKQNPPELNKLHKENYVIQSVIRTYIVVKHKKIDLFRIFDSFELSEKYPFIQYQPADSTPRFRYNEK